jgi:hypothetical protein
MLLRERQPFGRWQRAQQPGKLPTIGFLGTDASTWGPYTAAFVQRLRELGWIEGRTIAIEYRWSEGRPERNAEIAAEFVRTKVDVIVTNAFAASTVKQATYSLNRQSALMNRGWTKRLLQVAAREQAVAAKAERVQADANRASAYSN